MSSAADIKAGRQCGVYAIRNRRNGKCYFGSTVDFRIRKSRHKTELRRGTHHCQHLQRAWTKYGEEAFEFIFIRHVPNEMLAAAEQLYFDLFPVKYNTGIRPGASFHGRRHSAVSIEKMRSAAKGRIITPSQREKLRVANLGKKYPDAVKEKVSAAMTGRTISESHRKHLRGNGYWFNRKTNQWDIRLYEHKQLVFGARCRTKADATRVVEIVRKQIDSSIPICVPSELVIGIQQSGCRKKGRGYFFDRNAQRWKAAVYPFGRKKPVYLGSFRTEPEAAAAVAGYRSAEHV